MILKNYGKRNKHALYREAVQQQSPGAPQAHPGYGSSGADPTLKGLNNVRRRAIVKPFQGLETKESALPSVRYATLGFVVIRLRRNAQPPTPWKTTHNAMMCGFACIALTLLFACHAQAALDLNLKTP